MNPTVEVQPHQIDNEYALYPGEIPGPKARQKRRETVSIDFDIAKGGYYNLAIYNTAVKSNPGLANDCYDRGVAYKERREFDRSIKEYNRAIELNPKYAEAYYNRGEAWLHLEQWENAKSDLTTAKSMGINLLTAFDYLYESVQDFEQTNGVKVPEDIADLFSPEGIAMRKAELEQQMVEQAEQLSAEQLETVIDYMTKLREQEEWEATRELEGDPEIAKSLERAEADVKAGRLKSWDEVRRNV
jgi:tetratricopeptide (TPR) repeat protein